MYSLFFCWLTLLTSISPAEPLYIYTDKEVTLQAERGTLTLEPLNNNALRVRYRKKEMGLYPEEIVYTMPLTATYILSMPIQAGHATTMVLSGFHRRVKPSP